MRLDRARLLSISHEAYLRGWTWAKPWLRSIAWQWVGVVIAFTGALLLFAKIGEDVFDHESGTFDGVIREWILTHRTPFGTSLFLAVTLAGGTTLVTALAAIAAFWLWFARGRHLAAVMIAAAAVATASFVAIKEIFARVGPFGAAFVPHTTSYSFPSGHATVSAAVLSTLAYVLWRERLMAGRLALATSCVLFVAIGVSRVYLDVHWATDVLGGWCLGLGVAAGCAALYERWRGVSP
jgi:membrane-associated phospholipid phosphatase